MTAPRLTPQRIFALLLCLIALLCAGIAISVLAMKSSPEESPELRRQVELAAANAQQMMEQLSVLKARVQTLEKENQRLLAHAADSAQAARAATQPAPADPFQAEPPSAANPLVPVAPAPASPDAFFESLTAMLTGETNTTLGAATMVTGMPSRAMLGFIRAAGQQQARAEAKSRATELASRLGLPEEKRAAIEAAIVANQSGDMDVLESLMNAEASGAPPDLASLTNRVSEADVLRDLLAPDQLQAYETWQAAETQSNREAHALESLSQVQRALPDLNQEQKDRLYRHYLDQAATQPATPAPGLLGTALAQGLADPEKENQALRDILTPAQYESWQARQSQGLFHALPSSPGLRSGVSVRTIKVEAKPEPAAP